MKVIDEVKQKLNMVNFQQILKLDVDTDDYSFNDYLENSKQHPTCGFCVECELLGINKSNDSDGYRLMNISHGSHSLDFLAAMSIENSETKDWHEEGIMFVMESPSKGYEIYESKVYDSITKRPSKTWYWIHDFMKQSVYPDCFKSRNYGTLVSSIINTFKLKNAYLTNMVKCGMNDENGSKYKNLDNYDDRVINTCIDKHLVTEINIINPKVIFAFGSKTHRLISKYLKSTNIDSNLVYLPHPARSRQGFTDKFYNVLFFNIIAKELYRCGILDETEVTSIYKLFLNSNT